MVASKQRNMPRILNFQAYKQLECFNWIVASINVVTHENVPGFGYGATLPKQFEQIVELAMYISANSDGGGHRLNIRFFD